MSNNQPFPPLTMLPVLLHAIAGALDASKEQLENLLCVENKPYVLDDSIVNRLIKAFNEQLKTIASEKAICAYWRKQELTFEQIKAIESIEKNMAEMEQINQRILFLAEHYKAHTIDKILGAQEEELALAYLQGKLYTFNDHRSQSSYKDSRKPFSLPSHVTCQKTNIVNQGVRYVFRHAEWGEIGRIDVIPHGSQSKINTYAVAGDPRDPVTELRNTLFRTIAIEFSDELEKKYATGTTSATLPPFNVQSDAKMIESKIMVCLTCNAPVAFLIFAHDAETPDQLEDYVRMMYSKIVELNLPTWVIGSEEELVPDKEGIALILQIWPERRKAEKISSLIFEPMLHKIQTRHCK